MSHHNRRNDHYHSDSRRDRYDHHDKDHRKHYSRHDDEHRSKRSSDTHENINNNVKRQKYSPPRSDSKKQSKVDPSKPSVFLDVDWNNYTEVVSMLYFKNKDYFKKDSPEYDEFWDFLNKYIQFKKKQRDRDKAQQLSQDSIEQSRTEQLIQPKVEDSAPQDVFCFPKQFDESYLINFTILNDNPHEFLQRFEGRDIPKDREIDNSSSTMFSLDSTPKEPSAKDFLELRKVIHLYENFCQKKSFNKLLKIKQDRENLPIFKHRNMILEAVAKSQNSAILIAGDTGCGKSTQVVQYLMEAGYDKIACTQPRRIATMSLSKRVAYETLTQYHHSPADAKTPSGPGNDGKPSKARKTGPLVGYQIRFESSRDAQTRILFMTEGVLLRQVLSDPLLSRYNVIVIDEVHERHIHCDFLLAILRNIISQRSDLKLILMSATINIDLFSEYFNNAPIILVPGRLFPIQVEYHPIEEISEAERKLLEKDKDQEKKDKNKQLTKRRRVDAGPYLKVMKRIDDQFPSHERGDLLIFVSGIEDIIALYEQIQEYAKVNKNWIVLMLHSSLSIAEQDKVFDVPPEGVRKCIISTNIAETSVTIDGIRFCIDSGKVKEITMDSTEKIQKLSEYWISKASAEQRKGRAGRTGPGYCFRLYAKTEYDNFNDYAVPEIQRIPLESIILQIKINNLGDPRDFPFIEKPSFTSIEEAIENLKQLEALLDDSTDSMTALGSMLATLPVDVKIGKVLILGSLFHVLEPLLTIAAIFSVQSPFLRMAKEEQLSFRRRFITPHGDVFTTLNLYDEWIKVKTEGRENSRKWCLRHGVEEQRLYEITKLSQQFREILRECGVNFASDREEYEQNVFGQSLSKKRDIHRKQRQLQNLKMEHESANRGKKYLKMAEEEPGSDVDELDLKDLEFKLTQNVESLIRSSGQHLKKKDIALVSFIVSSGLYPHISICDEFNSNHTEADQMYHTAHKQFITIHPSSVFCGNSQYINPNTDLLCYEKLLVTNKPYLTLVTKIPALQSLLLVARSIDTNATLSQIVVDNWLLFEIESEQDAYSLISTMVLLRLSLRSVLNQALNDNQRKKKKRDGIQESENKPIQENLVLIDINKPETRTTLPSFMITIMEQPLIQSSATLADQLSHFLVEGVKDVKFRMRRLKEYEKVSLFRQPQTKSMAENPSEGTNAIQEASLLVDQSSDPMKQLEVAQLSQTEAFDLLKTGIKLTTFFRYNSIIGKVDANSPYVHNYSKYLQQHYHCNSCNRDFKLTAEEIAKHLEECAKKQNEV